MSLESLPKRLLDVFPTLDTLIGVAAESIPRNCYVLSFPLTKGKPGTVEEYHLGTVGHKLKAVIRITRDKVYWLFPNISSVLPHHVDTQLLLARLDDDQIVAFLPITTPEYTGTFRGTIVGGAVIARFERETTIGKQLSAKVTVAFASTTKEAVANVVWAARYAAVGQSNDVVAFPQETHIFSRGLTYCTWNSLQPPVSPTATNAIKTLRSLAESGIRPRAFLIDDAWQDVKDYRLQSFGCNPAFLDGLNNLGDLVAVARNQYGVSEVGAWHTIQGYWQGVEPTFFIEKYKLVKVTKDGYPGPAEPEGFSCYIVHPADVERFFDDYCTILAGHGITYTKCDNMASLDNLVAAREVLSIGADGEQLGKAVDMPSLRIAYKQAIIKAQRHFGSTSADRVIWCMEMTPRVLLGDSIGLPTSSVPKTRSVLRNSDDYYPDEPNSHRYHIFTNVVNALFVSQLNVVPDFDMFQSHPYIRPHKDSEAPHVQSSDNYPQAAFHAALRSLGAGPVTLTDVAGKTDPNIIGRLIGSLTKISHSVALHASSSPFVSNDIFDAGLLADGTGKALRVFSSAENALGGGMIGYWNIRSADGKVDDQVTISDISQLETAADRRLLLYSRRAQDIHVVDGSTITPPLPIKLDAFGFELVTVASIHSITEGRCEIAALGLIDKYNTLAGLVTFGHEAEDESKWIAKVKCSGIVGFWVKGGDVASLHVDGLLAKPTVAPMHEGVLLTLDLNPYVEGRTTEQAFEIHLTFSSSSSQ